MKVVTTAETVSGKAARERFSIVVVTIIIQAMSSKPVFKINIVVEMMMERAANAAFSLTAIAAIIPVITAIAAKPACQINSIIKTMLRKAVIAVMSTSAISSATVTILIFVINVINNNFN